MPRSAILAEMPDRRLRRGDSENQSPRRSKTAFGPPKTPRVLQPMRGVIGSETQKKAGPMIAWPFEFLTGLFQHPFAVRKKGVKGKSKHHIMRHILAIGIAHPDRTNVLAAFNAR